VATIRHLLSVSQLLFPSAYNYMYTAYFVEYIHVQHTLFGIYTAYFIWFNT